MIALTVKEQAKAIIDELLEEMVRDLLGLMQRLEEWGATLELLEDKAFMKAWERGKAEVERGETISWRKIKRTNDKARELST